MPLTHDIGVRIPYPLLKTDNFGCLFFFVLYQHSWRRIVKVTGWLEGRTKWRTTVNFRWISKKLRKNSFESVYKEWYIAYTTELISERLYFCIEALGRGVCRSILKVVCYGCVVVLHGLYH